MIYDEVQSNKDRRENKRRKIDNTQKRRGVRKLKKIGGYKDEDTKIENKTKIKDSHKTAKQVRRTEDRS